MVSRKKIVGIIPARFASSRFPGKPLIDLEGKPMIQHVVERVSQAQLVSQVLVATDDERIFKCVEGFGAKVVMTPADISSGTDRVAWAAKELDAEIILNIQGDEPLIDPKEIDLAAAILIEDSSAVMGTLVKRITETDELESPNTAKVVLDEYGNALYFSRSPIPYCREDRGLSAWIQNRIYFKHIGIYSYRKAFLLQFSQWEPTYLESVEKLEQLRVLEKGYRIKTAETLSEAVCVDTPEDAEKVRCLLKSESVFSK